MSKIGSVSWDVGITLLYIYSLVPIQDSLEKIMFSSSTQSKLGETIKDWITLSKMFCWRVKDGEDSRMDEHEREGPEVLVTRISLESWYLSYTFFTPNSRPGRRTETCFVNARDLGVKWVDVLSKF